MGAIDAEAIKAAVIGRLDRTYELFYTHQNDDLTDGQIDVLLQGDNPWESKEFTYFEEAHSDSRYAYALAAVREACEHDEYDVLAQNPDLLDEVRFAVEDRDTADPVQMMLRNSNHRLFRFDLDYNLAPDSHGWSEEATDEAARDLARATGLDANDTAVMDKMRELIAHATYGGRLCIIWYGDPEDAVKLGRARGLVTFHSPRLAVHDGWNGSGHDVGIDGDLLFQTWPGDVVIDSREVRRGGYCWQEICGPSLSAYGAEFTLKPDPDVFDDRYKIIKAWVGMAQPQFMFMFCDVPVLTRPTRDEAVAAAVEWHNEHRALLPIA